MNSFKTFILGKTIDFLIQTIWTHLGFNVKYGWEINCLTVICNHVNTPFKVKIHISMKI